TACRGPMVGSSTRTSQLWSRPRITLPDSGRLCDSKCFSPITRRRQLVLSPFPASGEFARSWAAMGVGKARLSGLKSLGVFQIAVHFAHKREVGPSPTQGKHTTEYTMVIFEPGPGTNAGSKTTALEAES